MTDDESNLLIRTKKGCHSPNLSTSNYCGIQESPIKLDDVPDMEPSLISGDRSSVLFTLERAVEILKSQMEHEEQRVQLRHKPLLPIWLTNHILLITFFIQGGGIICLIEAAHLVLVILVSFKLVKQVLHHTASGGFLAQCYLSTVLLFAGIYTVEFRFNEKAWEKVHAYEETNPVIVYLRMVYFSVSTATLCGTSTVEPLLWYSFLTVAAQMLLSFVYFTSILSMALIPAKRSKYGPRKKKPEKSLTRTLRKICSCCAEN